MRLADAELQADTGFLIARGNLTIGSETDAERPPIPKHDRLLLSFPWAPKGWPLDSWPPSFAIWPVTQVTRDQYGFCNVTGVEHGLAFHGLNLIDIADLRPDKSSKTIVRGGANTGNLVKHGNPMTPESPKHRNDALHTPIDSYVLTATYGSDGLSLKCEGRFAASQDESEVLIGADMRGKEFSVTALIPWETLNLKNFKSAGSNRLKPRGALPSKLDTADRNRDTRKLQDVLIAESLGWPFVKGQITLDGRLLRRARFLTVNFDKTSTMESIIFSEAPHMEILENGFVRSWLGDLSLIMNFLGRDFLERQIGLRTSLAIQHAGDGVGRIRCRTGFEYHDNYDQAIKSVATEVTLDARGLHLSAKGDLLEISIDTLEHYKRVYKHDLTSARTFALEAIFPWALLTALSFRFAYRAKKFNQ